MNRTIAAGLLVCSLAHSQDLDHIREVNLARIKSLPSFVADETIVRNKSRHVAPPRWAKFDTIESEVAVQKGVNFSRKNTRWNGKPTKKTRFPGYNWAVQFGLELKPLFDPECHTSLEFEGREKSEGRALLVYRFSAKPGGCFGGFSVEDSYFRPAKNWNPARTGRFKVEEQTGNLVEYEENASEFPKGFGMDPNRLIVKWDYVRIGDSSYLLPISWESFGGFVRGDLWHLEVTFRNHRHFEATTGITFQ